MNQNNSEPVQQLNSQNNNHQKPKLLGVIPAAGSGQRRAGYSPRPCPPATALGHPAQWPDPAQVVGMAVPSAAQLTEPKAQESAPPRGALFYSTWMLSR